MSPDLTARVAASRAAQGLPPVVTDPAVLSRAGALLRLAQQPLARSSACRMNASSTPGTHRERPAGGALLCAGAVGTTRLAGWSTCPV